MTEDITSKSEFKRITCLKTARIDHLESLLERVREEYDQLLLSHANLTIRANTAEQELKDIMVWAPPKDREIAELVNNQAEDEGLWFDAQTAPEAYLQGRLRELHALLEAKK